MTSTLGGRRDQLMDLTYCGCHEGHSGSILQIGGFREPFVFLFYAINYIKIIEMPIITALIGVERVFVIYGR